MKNSGLKINIFLTSLFKLLFLISLFAIPTLFRKYFVDLHFAQVLGIFVVNIYDKRLIRSPDKMQPFCFFYILEIDFKNIKMERKALWHSKLFI